MMTKNIGIIPVPVEVKNGTGVFRLDSNTQLIADCKSAESAKNLTIFVRNITDFRLKKRRLASALSECTIILRADDTSIQDDEGYILKISPSKIEIIACAKAGVFYGVQSLKQIILAQGKIISSGIELPCLEIYDKPRFEWRGFMLDSARHYQSVDFIKQLIDILAFYKINKFHWHFIDNTSWRFKSEKYPELSRSVRDITVDNGCYTSKQICDIIDYASKRCVAVYPELEMPGHSRMTLAHMPQLKCDGVSNNVVVNKYCLGRSATEKFHQDIIREIESVFSAPYIHIGGDEAFSTNWEFCRYCKRAMKERGLKNSKMLQKDFMRRMSEFVHSQNKISIAWADELSLGIPEGQIVQGWSDNGKESYVAAKKGFKTINSFHEYVYFDYPQALSEEKPAWMPNLPIEKVYSFDPVPKGLSLEQEKLILGSEACLWTEIVPQEDVFERIFPRMLAFAEVLWSEKSELNFESFQNRTILHHDILQKSDISFYKNNQPS